MSVFLTFQLLEFFADLVRKLRRSVCRGVLVRPGVFQLGVNECAFAHDINMLMRQGGAPKVSWFSRMALSLRFNQPNDRGGRARRDESHYFDGRSSAVAHRRS